MSLPLYFLGYCPENIKKSLPNDPLNIWDFSGDLSQYPNQHPFLFKHSIYILGWDVTQPFEDIPKFWLEILNQRGLFSVIDPEINSIQSKIIFLGFNTTQVSSTYKDRQTIYNKFKKSNDETFFEFPIYQDYDESIDLSQIIHSHYEFLMLNEKEKKTLVSYKEAQELILRLYNTHGIWCDKQLIKDHFLTHETKIIIDFTECYNNEQNDSKMKRFYLQTCEEEHNTYKYLAIFDHLSRCGLIYLNPNDESKVCIYPRYIYEQLCIYSNKNPVSVYTIKDTNLIELWKGNNICYEMNRKLYFPEWNGNTLVTSFLTLKQWPIQTKILADGFIPPDCIPRCICELINTNKDQITVNYVYSNRAKIVIKNVGTIILVLNKDDTDDIISLFDIPSYQKTLEENYSIRDMWIDNIHIAYKKILYKHFISQTFIYALPYYRDEDNTLIWKTYKSILIDEADFFTKKKIRPTSDLPNPNGLFFDAQYIIQEENYSIFSVIANIVLEKISVLWSII